MVQLGRELHDGMKRWGELRAKGEPATFSSSHRSLLTEVMVVRAASVLLTLARPATSHFFFVFFLYRSFLPFLSFGRILRTLLISLSLHGRTRIPPTWATGGAGIFFAAM